MLPDDRLAVIAQPRFLPVTLLLLLGAIGHPKTAEAVPEMEQECVMSRGAPIQTQVQLSRAPRVAEVPNARRVQEAMGPA